MADFTFVPEHPYHAKLQVEETTINELADMSELRLEQGETIGGTYTERYRMNGAEIVSLLAFWKTRRQKATFTKKSYDPLDAAFDTDDPAATSGPEETVRFMSMPNWSWRSRDDYDVSCTFKIISNE